MDENGVDSTRDRIRQVATELYVARGFDGFSFGDIAEVVGGTRANIHHHFGSKRKLVDELVDEIVRDAKKRISEHWASDDVPFAERLDRQLADLHRFYRRYNPGPGGRRIWSPVSRLRHDLEILGDRGARALEDIGIAYDAALTEAVSAAVRSGEFRPDTPVAAVAGLLRVAFLACPPLTQDGGSFEEVEHFLATLHEMLIRAWAGDRPPP